MIIILIKKKVIRYLNKNKVCVKSFKKNFNYKNLFLIAKNKK